MVTELASGPEFPAEQTTVTPLETACNDPSAIASSKNSVPSMNAEPPPRETDIMSTLSCSAASKPAKISALLQPIAQNIKREEFYYM